MEASQPRGVRVGKPYFAVEFCAGPRIGEGEFGGMLQQRRFEEIIPVHSISMSAPRWIQSSRLRSLVVEPLHLPDEEAPRGEVPRPCHQIVAAVAGEGK